MKKPQKPLTQAQIKKLITEIRSETFHELPTLLRDTPELLPTEIFGQLAMYLEGRERLVFMDEIASACGYKVSTVKTYMSRGEPLSIPPLRKFGKRWCCLRSELDVYLEDRYNRTVPA